MAIVCQECDARCCEAVKRLPYLGEVEPALFSTLLIGAVADPDPDDEPGLQRPLVVEWIIPGEAQACPAYGEDGLCSIHPIRPTACRRFPMTKGEGYHPFCPYPKEVVGEPWREYPVEAAVAALDALLLNVMTRQGSEAAGRLVGEDDIGRMPLLYNGYLLAVLLLVEADYRACIQGQRKVLEWYRNQGHSHLTYRIPDSEFAVTASIEGLETNLMWLEARIQEWNLAGAIKSQLNKHGLVTP